MATTQPGIPDGWTRVQMQMPTSTADTLRAAVQAEGMGSQKLIGTSAILLFLSLSPKLRSQIIDYVATATRRDPNSLGPADLANKFVEALGDTSPTHYIDRILDPQFKLKDASKLFAARLKKGA